MGYPKPNLRCKRKALSGLEVLLEIVGLEVWGIGTSFPLPNWLSGLGESCELPPPPNGVHQCIFGIYEAHRTAHKSSIFRKRPLNRSSRGHSGLAGGYGPPWLRACTTMKTGRDTMQCAPNFLFFCLGLEGHVSVLKLHLSLGSKTNRHKHRISISTKSKDSYIEFNNNREYSCDILHTLTQGYLWLHQEVMSHSLILQTIWLVPEQSQSDTGLIYKLEDTSENQTCVTA